MTIANVANILTLVVSLSVHLQSHVVDLDLEARAKQRQECWLHPHQYVPFFPWKYTSNFTQNWLRISATLISRLMLNLRDPKVVSHSNQRTEFTTTFSEPLAMVTTVVDPQFPVYDDSISGADTRSPTSE